MVTLTIKEVNEKTELMGSILTEANDKLNYAIKKVFNQMQSKTKGLQKTYNQNLEDLRIKHASTYPADYSEVEKRGLLIVNEKGAYSFTKEATIAFNTEVRPINEAFESKTVDIEPYKVGTGSGWERVDTIDLFIREELKDILFLDFKVDEAEVKEEAPKKLEVAHVAEELPVDEVVNEKIQEQV